MSGNVEVCEQLLNIEIDHSSHFSEACHHHHGNPFHLVRNAFSPHSCQILEKQHTDDGRE
jgi:hypothetical protein